MEGILLKFQMAILQKLLHVPGSIDYGCSFNPEKSPFATAAYANKVKRVWGDGQELRYFRDQMGKAGPTAGARPVVDNGDVDLDELEAKLSELESELIDILSNTDKLKRTHAELTELHLVLERLVQFVIMRLRHRGGNLKVFGVQVKTWIDPFYLNRWIIGISPISSLLNRKEMTSGD